MFKSWGTLRYSPTLNRSLERRDGGTTKWWLIIECDPEIGRYYRKLHHLGMWRTVLLQRPLWGEHVSLITGEQPFCEEHWGKHDGEKILFEYESGLEGNDTYCWLRVSCPAAERMRRELGLSPRPFYPFHLTIGNNKPS